MVRGTVVLLVAGMLGCQPEAPAPERSKASLQRLRAGTGDSGTTLLGMHFLGTDAHGAALTCEPSALEVVVSYSRDEGATWVPLDDGSMIVQCADGAGGDLALVVDNSGSEAGFLDPLRDGATAMVDGVLDAGGRGGLVRVSTDSRVLAPLTSDRAALDVALGELHVANGWTALWDGIRMGNEVLGAGRPSDGTPPPTDLAGFCGAEEPLGIVAFTDGQENNSDSSQSYDHARYPGDGYDTTLDDLKQLRLGSTTTPIYTIGLGNEVDHAVLEELATATGGRHRAIDDVAEIPTVYDDIGAYFSSMQQVCAEIPEQVCGDLDVRIDYTWTVGADVFQGVEDYEIYVPCPVTPDWRTITMLLTVENEPGLGDENAARLVTQAVSWVSGMDNPNVLVVLDDNHHGENQSDPDYVQSLLQGAGIRADRLDEPAAGLTDADIDGYDVVWFSNPGYPLDDLPTFETLARFADEGGGLVLQGDDISQSDGNAFDMSSLTHLEFQANGTEYCGVDIDDNSTGNEYRVTLDGTHPVLDGLPQLEFLYGNDIDTTSFIDHEGASSIASAVPDGIECTEVPVIVAYDPP